MKKCFGFILLILLGGLLFAADQPKFEPLPVPISNNAVASVKSRGSLLLYSMMGMGAKKTWDATSNTGYMLDSESDTGKWAEVRSVPGTVGRLAATAVGAREHIFLFGGYVVDAQGGETTLPDVNAYEPLTDRWFRAEDMPVAVDDAVAELYRDRYIYMVGGWSKTDTVRDVQVYDAEKNNWSQATPIPGTPVFGHAGAVVGDTIVYIDGAYKNPAGGQPKYIASDECWMGKIDHHDRSKIQWTKLPSPSWNRALPHRGGRLGKRPEDLFLRRDRQSVQLQRHRIQRSAGGAFARDLCLQLAHRQVGNHQRAHAPAHHGSSRVDRPAGRIVDCRRHGERRSR